MAEAVSTSFPEADAADVMTSAAAYGLATALSALVLAPAIDRIGRRNALARALAVMGVALALSALAPGLLALCLAQALAGLAAGCALPAIYALSVRVAAKGRESETLGIVLVGWTASLVAGASLSAVLADVAHWRAVFAGFSLAAAGIALDVRRGSGWPAEAPGAAAASPFAALRVPGIAPALLTVAAYMTAFYGLYTYLGPHLAVRLGFSTASAGLAPLGYGLGFGAAAFVDRVLDRCGAVAAAPVAFLGLGLVYAALAAAAADGALLIVLCVAWGLANHVGVNLIVSRLAALDPARSGAIMGLYSAVTYLAVCAGALVYQPLFRSIGFAGCALASAGCIAPVLVAAFVQARRHASGVGPASLRLHPGPKR